MLAIELHLYIKLQVFRSNVCPQFISYGWKLTMKSKLIKSKVSLIEHLQHPKMIRMHITLLSYDHFCLE